MHEHRFFNDLNLNVSNSSNLNAFEKNESENNKFEENAPDANASDLNQKKKKLFNHEKKTIFKREEKIVFNREKKNSHFISRIKIMQNNNALNELYWLYDNSSENLKSK